MNRTERPRRRQSITTVAGYLAARVHQLGIDCLFGLPGDFNLALIDEMLDSSGLEWVGSTNELNAAYAADGYARRRGFGALVTTFGVGELSAINGVAGSCAESVPVLQITGAPPTGLAEAGAMAHHTLVDGDFGHFRRAYDEVTVASEALTSMEPGRQIDRVLTAMVANCKPGYLSVPADLVSCPVPAHPLRRSLASPSSDPVQLEAFTREVDRRLGVAHQITLLTGHLVQRRNLHHLIERAAASVTIASVLGGQGVAGGSVYVGGFTPERSTRLAVEECDTLIVAGTVFSDITSGMYTHQIDLDRAIVLDLDRAAVGSATFEGLRLEDTLEVVVGRLGSSAHRAVTDHAPEPAIGPFSLLAGECARGPAADVHRVSGSSGPLTHEQLWPTLEHWLPAGTTVLADAGTAYYGAACMRLPIGCELVGQPIWSSIGYTLPALLGIELAEPGRRPVLLIGDGAAQLTIQELGTILHRRLNVVIIVLNNGGYTIERQIRSPDAVYQDVTPWDWTALPTALGQPGGIDTAVVSDLDQLEVALARAVASDSGAALIEVRLHRDDAPPLLAAIAAGLRPHATRAADDLLRSA